MQVRATRHGFYGATFYAPGDVFEVSEGLRGSWFTPLGAAREPAAVRTEEPDVGKPRRGRPSGGLRKPSETPAPAPIDPGLP